MTEPHYALREFALLREEYETLNLYALVDGIQFDRFFDEPLKEGKDIRSLFILPEDRILAFAGPWLLDVSKLSREYLVKISQLEEKYPAVSWIISEQPFVKLARHLESGLMVSLPSKDKGLFRFYDSRVLKILPELLSPEQFARLMKYSLRWFFLSEGEINCYQCGAGVLEHRIIGNNELGREVL
ncbi:TPA: DUF4123 domain-containing protein [Klebsiella pneumoniae]|jgi:hypothetical protein|uniref:DUF4123 domain-containing protein n=2 Tax=Klebsiella pneumoniae TaxID=573 RepID=A0A483F0W5_KLEPN|nr:MULTISPECIES: DUF4123 domain-containing protein [Klebsiella]EIV5304338.1 DUF4123 domain-containing protein [Klebsiella pneumoniae]EIV7287111.1 DUF4123 domain-containing protein [Klebsiella pneumoniae]EIW8613792.1 DUF4123 domain-containing protein [Klebsiella pneumoniae]EIX9227387.1 DUF4123 domain-containing protein [Klebsiella pneumoniae]EIX9460169.1 DUF4123 domain-containing protein [Klebsiella pneumoniae]